MILKNLCLFSQNIQKNRIFTNIILETKKDFDILFIQEPLWAFICSILSSSNKKGDKVVSVSNHSNWLIFFRSLIIDYDHSRVITYINMRLDYLYFSFRKDIFNHGDINCFSFFNNGSIFFMINVYSNEHQIALKYLKDTKANLCNVLVMAKDFNIRDSN